MPPRRAIISTVTSRLAHRILPIRQDVVRANLELAFGRELSERVRDQLAKSFYEHFFRSLGEFFTFPLLLSRKRASMVKTVGEEHLFEAANLGRGVLLLGGHLGNWEIALAGAMLNLPAMRGRISVLRRSFKPAWLERYVRCRFEAAGLRTIEKKNSMNIIMRRLAANEMIGFVLDQHSSPKEGIRVGFFGSPAWTFRSLAVIARRTGAPVVPLATWREPDGGHVVQLRKSVEWITGQNFEEDIRLNTQLYNNVLEHMIRAHPEQWIWNHRRWKN
jgi:KDO2-lipid IV(A) lauroyltransferase